MTTSRTSRRLAVRVLATAGALAAFTVLVAGCGSSSSGSTPSTSASAAPASGPQTVTLSEWKVDVPTSIAAGQVSFKIVNNGSVQHELLVFKADLDPSGYPTDDSGAIKEEDPSISKSSDGDNLDPSATQTRTVDLTKPGKYLFVCNLPGHFKQGMATVVIVH